MMRTNRLPLLSLLFLLAAAPLACKDKRAPARSASEPSEEIPEATAEEKPAAKTAAKKAPTPAPSPAPVIPPGAPAWASPFSAAHPQPAVPDEIFDALRLAPASGDTLNGLMMICRARTVGRFDAFRGPDISLNITVGKAARITYRGAEDTYTAYVAVRLATLTKGTTINVSVYDRDATGREHIGSAKLTFGGSFPLRDEGPNLKLECRAALAGSADTLLSDEVRKTAAMFKKAPGDLKPIAGALDWGLLQGPIPRLHVQITGEAALVGWEDARVRAHLGELAALQKRWDLLAAAAVEDAAKSLPARADGVLLSVIPAQVHVVSAACDAPKTCEVVLKLKNRGEANLRCNTFHSWLGKIKRLSLVGPAGRMTRLKLKGCVVGKKKVGKVAPGETATLELVPAKPRKGVTQPSPVGARLLWLSDFIMRRHDLLRL
jgi:hypothetical protein